MEITHYRQYIKYRHSFCDKQFFSQNFVNLTPVSKYDLRCDNSGPTRWRWNFSTTSTFRARIIFLNVGVPIIHVTSNIGIPPEGCSCGDITPKPCNIGTQKYF